MKTIKLTKGQEAIVDDSDFEYLSQFNWFANPDCNTYYASRNIRVEGKKTTIRMHQELLQVRNGCVVDHIDRNGLNNQHENLREATNSQSQHNTSAQKNNTSGFKGVSWDKNRNKYQVNIMVDGKNKKIGRYSSYQEAVNARKKADNIYHKFNSSN